MQAGVPTGVKSGRLPRSFTIRCRRCKSSSARAPGALFHADSARPLFSDASLDTAHNEYLQYLVTLRRAGADQLSCRACTFRSRWHPQRQSTAGLPRAGRSRHRLRRASRCEYRPANDHAYIFRAAGCIDQPHGRKSTGRIARRYNGNTQKRPAQFIARRAFLICVDRITGRAYRSVRPYLG